MTQKRQIANMYKAHMASINLDPKNREHNAVVAKETGIDPERLLRLRTEGIKKFHREEAAELDRFFDAQRKALGKESRLERFGSCFPEGKTEIILGQKTNVDDPSTVSKETRKPTRPTAHTGHKKAHRYEFSSGGISEDEFRLKLKELLKEKIIDAGFYTESRDMIRFTDFGAAVGLDSERIRTIVRGGNVFTESEIARLDNFFDGKGRSTELKEKTFADLFKSNEVPPIGDKSFYGKQINGRNQLAQRAI